MTFDVIDARRSVVNKAEVDAQKAADKEALRLARAALEEERKLAVVTAQLELKGLNESIESWTTLVENVKETLRLPDLPEADKDELMNDLRDHRLERKNATEARDAKITAIEELKTQ
jgi:hypothetical protein